MRILVTGAAGFIGSHLVDALMGAGHDVTGVDNLDSACPPEYLDDSIKEALKVDDIRHSTMVGLFIDCHFDVVYHLAAQSSYRWCVSNPYRDADTNIKGTINLLEQCKSKSRRVGKVIFASSAGGVYGDQPKQPVHEDAKPAPMTQYGVSKLAGEEYIKQYSRLYGIDYAILRLGNVYGPRQNPLGEAGVVSKMIHAALTGKPITVTGDGSQSRDFVYVSDVVKAFINALSLGSGEVYNIGSGHSVTIGMLAHWILSEYSESTEIKYSERVPGEFHSLTLSRTKAYSGLRWYPTVTLEDGLDLTAQWMSTQVKESV